MLAHVVDGNSIGIRRVSAYNPRSEVPKPRVAIVKFRNIFLQNKTRIVFRRLFLSILIIRTQSCGTSINGLFRDGDFAQLSYGCGVFVKIIRRFQHFQNNFL